jgi:ATPase subunit of ABC transporter with duplicated ATPase domains
LDVAGWILELDRGEGIPWKGNYSSWLKSQAEWHLKKKWLQNVEKLRA